MYTKSAVVYVAGVGVVSAIGNNTTSNLLALEKGNAGIGAITLLDTIHRGILPVAEVKLDNRQLAALTGFSPEVSRTALLGMLAAKEAWQDAGIAHTAGLRTGFVSANSVGGMDKTESFFAEFLKNNKSGRLKNAVNHECGAVTELVADGLGIKNFITTISTACSSSANSIFFGARLIKHNLLDVVVTGGADALTKFTLNGFNTLQILDKALCMPFDENRRGLNLGEGAGYLVLVSEKVAAGIKDRLYCRLSGYSNANDAHHQTASSPDGAGSYLAMKGALELSGLQTTDISYINLHGTGTFNNDISEGTAIQRLFEPHYPAMSSTKAFTGHTLGASGGIEAVFSSLAIRHNFIYPNLRLKTPMQALPFVPEKLFQKNITVNHVLSNSFGFGGNCSSLIFSKP
ncbi:MAG: beta-ketoacyl-[acyl-carrier-protein] synthase family protein [Bacteroidota bacterium]